MSLSSTTVLNRWDPANIGMTLLLLLLFEWKILIELGHIRYFLELICVACNLLLQVLNPLCNALRNLQVVLHLLHRCSNLGLLKGILRECLMRILKLPDLFSLQVDLCHFTMIVRQLLIIVVISWLLVFLELVDDLLSFLVIVIAIFVVVFRVG